MHLSSLAPLKLGLNLENSDASLAFSPGAFGQEGGKKYRTYISLYTSASAPAFPGAGDRKKKWMEKQKTKTDGEGERKSDSKGEK